MVKQNLFRFFASNFVGVEAMSAVGLYAPIPMLLGALTNLLMGGASVLCGKYAGKNDQKRLTGIYTVNIVAAVLLAVLFTSVLLVFSVFDLTGFFTNDEAVRPLLNQYLIGQAIGIFPYVVGNQLPAYLVMENRNWLTTAGSVTYIVLNIAFSFIFVNILHMGTLGLALAVAFSSWGFLLVVAWPFLLHKTHFRLSLSDLRLKEGIDIARVGFPGAASNLYQTLRGFIVNWLIIFYVGSVGVSAFATANNFLTLFWSIPGGMFIVSRLMISVSIGEEDRQSLTDVMRVMFRRFIPLQCAISAALILCAVPITHLFYHDPSESVFVMTVWGFRILPLCMPLSIILMHFTGYGQAMGKTWYVNILAFLDGVFDVAVCSALLVPFIGMNGVYTANVANGVITTLVIIGYAWIRVGRFPRSMSQLMVIPEDFGASEDDRMDVSVNKIEDIPGLSERVQGFCLERGADHKRAYAAGLALEEMAGNVILHGFTKDRRKHSVDVRVTYKDEGIILVIRDDCVPFNPGERQKLSDDSSPFSNIGLCMVYGMADDIQYQNILGMNILTIKINART